MPENHTLGGGSFLSITERILHATLGKWLRGNWRARNEESALAGDFFFRKEGATIYYPSSIYTVPIINLVCWLLSMFSVQLGRYS